MMGVGASGVALALALTLAQPKAARDCAACPPMIAVPGAGLTAIRVAVTPVTFAEWRACVMDGGCGGYRPDQQGWPDDAPVVNVSYEDAESYASWLSRKTGRRYRLPSEAEWPALALGGRVFRYPWGDRMEGGRANCLTCGGRWAGRRASPVRSFPPNALGLYDAVGNVAQWLAPGGGAPHRCRARFAAIAGASWADPATFLDVREMTCFPRVLRDDTIGFRVMVEG